MLRHVIAPTRFFSQTPNEIIRHPRLGSDAVRILTWQLSLPEGEDEALSATAAKARVRRAGFNRAKRELKDEGYLHEWRVQGPRGRWCTHQLLSNVPLSPEQASAVWSGDVRRDSDDDSGAPPSDKAPAVGGPAGRDVGGPPNRTPPVNTPQPSAPAPELPEAHRLIQELPSLDPRLRVPRGMLPQLTELAGKWLTLGHTPDGVRDEIRRNLPPVIHKPGGLVRHLLSDPPPPRPQPAPVAALRECAGPHPQPLVFRPVAGEDRCGSCRQDRAVHRAAVQATARGALAVRTALRGARV
ncbi:hypothetical protein [Streptomyces spectabilis]|uniref:Uncharacterized protein n=1 Tax=Streptomyces spectabilis TaxID=68270 RepID=A0A7W8EZI8_STRST|nr:hypothetical protein [Streptomyces spectabilis]MBB5109483.1 hypothetical protein [Streptomyces spectabilis]MCI3904646.1 hypothetical protein [Streptomyces spectabilis]GGV54634.1 hypothetical protein GCM10010245_86430 [Streptomyces spectabilis]